jgi:hypothetical protein
MHVNGHGAMSSALATTSSAASLMRSLAAGPATPQALPRTLHRVLSRRRSSQYGQRWAENLLGICRFRAGSANLLERAARLRFTKTEATERAKHLRVRFGDAWPGCPTVHGSVGVPEPQSRRGAAFDEQCTSMACAMMCSTKHNQLVRIVTAAFRAQVYVVNI